MRHKFLLAGLLLGSTCLADGPADNQIQNVRPIPPKGIAVPPEQRTAIQNALGEFTVQLAALKRTVADRPALVDLLPDVEIYHKAVDWALRYDEFYNPREFAAALALVAQGKERADLLARGEHPWTGQTGLVVRGYVSKIDGSVQPYGLVVPEDYKEADKRPRRLDLWWHGRGETLSELSFIDGRQRSAGEFTPKGAFVLHPYGRYCNANKFAGEVDTFEAIQHAQKHYPIDENRIVARGFSMGGAACWQFAVHFPGYWAAAAPGAGFSETPDFLKVFQRETLQPTWWEQRLWRMHDCTDYALNLWNLPTVAYSGEKDSQKQAADMMEKSLSAEGMKLDHVIGAGAGHSYTTDAKAIINSKIDGYASTGRNPAPHKLKFVTYTLAYNKMAWITLTGLEKHWERAQVEAEVTGPSAISVQTRNVSRFAIQFEAKTQPVASGKAVTVSLDGQSVRLPAPASNKPYSASLIKTEGKWKVGAPGARELVKSPGLQGPIDDAFLSRFTFVMPTGQPLNQQVGLWVDSEMNRAIKEWRSQYRGDALVKADAMLTDEDIRNSNLVLWGDPQSNSVLKRVLSKLPITWTSNALVVGGKSYAAQNHAPILVFPNPLNPKKYVVLNSGFTFREYDQLNNARQVSKLPDWAVVDLSEKPNSRWPGKVVDAGFFGERWEWIPNGGRE